MSASTPPPTEDTGTKGNGAHKPQERARKANSADRDESAPLIFEDATDPYKTVVPNGEYIVALRRVTKGHVFKQDKWFAECEIITDALGDTAYAGKRLLRFYTYSDPRKRLALTHNLARDFERISGGRRPPSKGLTPAKLLKDTYLLAEVVAVKQSAHGRKVDGKQVERPEASRYSKVERFVHIVEGCPPCLRGVSRA